MKDLILLVTQNDDTFNNPVLDSFFHQLEKSNRNVLVLCSKNVFPNTYPNVKISRLLQRKRPRRDIVINFFIDIIQFFVFNFYYRHVKTIIGVDPQGLVAAHKLKKRFFKSAPLDYFSFELFYDEHFLQKQKEIEACRDIRYLIIQDSLREKELKKINGVAKDVTTIYMPVASTKKVEIPAKKPDNFRRKHNISAEKKLVVSFGTLEDWTGGLLVADMVEKDLIPKDYILVIHSRFPLSEKNPVHKKLIDLSKSNEQLILNNDYIPKFEDAVSFLTQFDAGLVIYIPVIENFNALLIGENILHIGLASGKFSMLMQAGVPVLAYENPTYCQMFAQYNIGQTFKTAGELGKILNEDTIIRISRDECLSFYEQHLNNEKTIREYISHC